MNTTHPARAQRSSTPIAAALDTLAVFVFVTIGRRNHDEGVTVAGVAKTAAPFLIALAVAWLALRAWRRPFDWVVGAAIWSITIVGGVVLRRLVFGDGTAISFVIVAAAFLAATIVGWRLIARFVANR